jgi:hypothetical protein
MLEYWNIGLKCEQKFLYLYTATLITTKDVSERQSYRLIPAPYQVRGRLSQARNDKLDKIYVVMYIIPLFHFCKLLTL